MAARAPVQQLPDSNADVAFHVSCDTCCEICNPTANLEVTVRRLTTRGKCQVKPTSLRLLFEDTEVTEPSTWVKEALAESTFAPLMPLLMSQRATCPESSPLATVCRSAL